MWGYHTQRHHHRRQRYQRPRRNRGCACCLVYFFGAIFVILLAFIAYSPDRQQAPLGDENSGSRKMALEPGIIAGIAMTVVFFVVLIIIIFSCCFCLMRRQQQVNQQQGGATFRVHQPGPQYYANSDPRYRNSRSASYTGGQGGRGPTVFVYHTDAGRPSNAPRFYYHKEAEEVDEEETRNGAGSPTSEGTPTTPTATSEPIVEFPDDDDDDEEGGGEESGAEREEDS